MHISWPLKTINGTFEVDLDEKQITMKLVSAKKINWFFDLTTTEKVTLPFNEVAAKNIDCSFEGMKYTIKAGKGSFSTPGKGAVFRISPQLNTITLNLADY